jgi:hypothetical protein
LSIYQKALGTLLEDGNVTTKYVGAIISKLNEKLMDLLVFMHISNSICTKTFLSRDMAETSASLFIADCGLLI